MDRIICVVGPTASGKTELALRLAGNTALGFGAVWALNLTTAYTGLSLGLNLFNALTVAILGLPGFCLLLLVKWVLGT